ncbi:putative ribonuclease H protein [Senna tora]|uniref:Putative ribonuclease H protein n=1 Tax=Senna tora TaxID=362788 RepID=A0A834WAQ4_9FABA|nr:putative ribonuclease H protein [Senna tora]
MANSPTGFILRLDFVKSNTESATLTKRILDAFGHISGLFMNPNKSEIKFSSKCSPTVKAGCATIWQCQIVDRLGKYLGGFIDGLARDRQNYKVILDHLTKRLQGWKAQLLSQAARCTLIKAVLTATPIYYLQFTKLNRKEVAHCDRVLSRFFWGHTPDKPDHIAWRVGNGTSINLSDEFWFPMDKQKHDFSLLASHGTYTIKDAYSHLSSDRPLSRGQEINWLKLWKIQLPFEILLFFWMLLHQSLPLGVHLIRRRFRIEGKCSFGCDVIEDKEHLFKDCPFARAVWFEESILHEIIITCWGIYTQRNKVLFSKETPDPACVVNTIQNFNLTLKHIQELPSFDPFFKMQNMVSPCPNTMSTTSMANSDTINLFCCRLKCRFTNKKETHILWEQQDRTIPFLIFTSNYRSEAYLIMLQAIRQGLRWFQLRILKNRITIHIPNRQLFSYLYLAQMAPTRIAVVCEDINILRNTFSSCNILCISNQTRPIATGNYGPGMHIMYSY